MRCPRCKNYQYRTIRSEKFSQTRIRKLRCEACGKCWQTEERFDQRHNTIVIKVDRSHYKYNRRTRLIMPHGPTFETIEAKIGYKLPEQHELFG